MDLHAYTKSIGELLSVNKKYLVPRFQREFSWQKEEVIELWQDILSNIAVEDGKCVNTEYFIGALVLVGETTSFALKIVDGQQRLTTITIMLSALTQAYRDIGQGNLAEALYNSYIEGKDTENSPYFKLVNETPKPFFQCSIQNFDKEARVVESEEEQNLIDAFKIFTDRLKKEYIKSKYRSFDEIAGDEGQKYKTFLNAMRDQVLSFLKVIYITVADEEDAYTIFETLNARGMSLSAVDLVKNVIFKELNKQHPDDYAKTKWKSIQATLTSRSETIQLDTFFRHFWLSKYGFTSEGRIYKSFKNLIEEEATDSSSFLDLLVENSEYYNCIVNTQENDWPQQEEKVILRSLEALNLFKVVQPRPFLLALKRARMNAKIKLVDYIEIIKVLEKFHFMFTAICSSRASGIDGKYSKAARDLEASTSIVKSRAVISALKKDLVEKVPPKTEFKSNFEKLWFTNQKSKDKRLIQYIFWKMELDLRQTNELTTNFITLEHIIPQSEVSAINFVGLIGNLIPLDRELNQAASTSPYTSKIAIFKDSELKVVEDFVTHNEAHSTWTEQKTRARTTDLSKKAYEKIWKI